MVVVPSMTGAKNKHLIDSLSALEKIIMSEETVNYILKHRNHKVAAKIVRDIRLLNGSGLDLPEDYIHRIWASKEKLWALRTRFSNNTERTLFFVVHEGKFLLTNCFRKDTKEIPENQIRKAEKVLHEYLKSMG